MVQRCKFSGEPICQILEEQTGERVGSFGSSGQGPGEFVAAEFIGKTEGDDTLYFVICLLLSCCMHGRKRVLIHRW